jgi:hypothetical protein
MDQSFINFYGSFSAAKNRVNDLLADVEANNGLTVELANGGFQVDFVINHFCTSIVPNTWRTGSNSSNHTTNIRNFWIGFGKNCIKQDGLVLFTVQDYNNGATEPNPYCRPGFGFQPNVVHIVRDRPNEGIDKVARTLGHELMHAFGIIGHVDAPPTNCSSLCPDRLMCESPTTTNYYLTSCDFTCISNFFSKSGCDCLQQTTPFFPDDFVCPANAAITSEVNNRFPVAACGDNDEISFSIGLINGSVNANRNIRVFIAEPFATQYSLIDGANDPDCQSNPNGLPICFNHEIIVNTPSFSGKEFRILNPSSNSEQEFSLGIQEEIMVKLKLRYIGNNLNAENHSFLVYSGANLSTPTVTNTITLQPTVKITGSPTVTLGALETAVPPSGFSTNRPLLIDGKLIVNSFFYNSSLQQTTWNFSGNQQLYFTPGSGIEITNNSTTFNNVKMEGCTHMWEGIIINSGATLLMNNSKIADAQKGIEIRRGGHAVVTGTSFENNYFGVYIPANTPQSTGSIDAVLNGNRYITTEAGLKAPYSGQVPYLPGKGYAGICVYDVPGLILQGDGLGRINCFENLRMGILGINSIIKVRDSKFLNIQEELISIDPKADFHPIDISTYNGRGIQVLDGTLIVNGRNDESFTEFNQVSHAIEAEKSYLRVSEAYMKEVATGIVSYGNINKSIQITNNHIDCTENGISVFDNFAYHGVMNILNNEISVKGEVTATGIFLSNSGAFSKKTENVAENTITVKGGQAAIWANNRKKITFANNQIQLEDPATNRFGIRIEGGSNHKGMCNVINGVNSTLSFPVKGLYVGGSSRGLWNCNIANGSNIGMNFSGDCSLSAVRGNTMNGATKGLLYGLNNGLSSVLVGQQIHQGNVWINTNAQYNGSNGSAAQNGYLVDPSQNSNFLPIPILGPLNWFSPEITSIQTYNCLSEISCLDASFLNDDEPQLLRSATRNVYADFQQNTLRDLVQLHLYEHLLERGMPTGASSTLTNFFNTTLTPAPSYKRFGDMQHSLAAAYHLNYMDSLALWTAETTQVRQMDSIALLDKQIGAPKAPPADSVTLRALKSALLMAAGTHYVQYNNRLNTLSQSRLGGLNALGPQNQALNTSMIWEENQKSVNRIFLSSSGALPSQLTEIQLAELQIIAEQCPLEGGDAVYQARAVLQAHSRRPLSFDDEALCQQSQERNWVAPAISGVKVVPNPNTGNFALILDISEESRGLLRIFNATGQEVYRRTVDCSVITHEIALGKMPAGVYSYNLSTDTGTIRNGQFIIHTK